MEIPVTMELTFGLCSDTWLKEQRGLKRKAILTSHISRLVVGRKKLIVTSLDRKRVSREHRRPTNGWYISPKFLG